LRLNIKMNNKKIFGIAALGALAILAFAVFASVTSALSLPPVVSISATPNPANFTSTIIAVAVDLSGSGISRVSIFEDGVKVKEVSTSTAVFVAVHTSPGTRSYYAVASDYAGGETSSQTINVGFQNSPPILNAIGNKVVNAGELLTFNVSGYDYENESLTYSASGLPGGATFNALTKTFSWQTLLSQTGSYNVTFSLNDSFGFDSETVRIDVINLPPQIQFVSPTEVSGSSLNRSDIFINVTAIDSDLSTITINLYNATNSLVFSTSSAFSPFYVNLLNLANGTYYFNATASDSFGNSNSTETRNITVSGNGTGVIGVGGPVSTPEEEEESSASKIKNVTESDLIRGVSISLNTNDRLRLILCGAPYFIKLTDVDSNANEATFSLNPGAYTFTLKEGRSEEIDLDSDLVNDITFRVESTSTERAKVYLKRISGLLCEPTSQIMSVNVTYELEKLAPKEKKLDYSLTIILLIGGILLLGIAIGIYYLTAPRKR